MKKADFYVVTDTHYFENSLGAYGKEYEEHMRFEQKCFAETQAINEALFDYLCSVQSSDTVLIAGDLTHNGERASHIAFVKLLRKLKDSGKKVRVITADHDYKEHPFAFDENGRHDVEGIKREELFDMYYEFGFEDALAVDREHLSYVSQLSDGVRLLALNNDGDGKDNKTYDEKQLAWIKEQIDKANAEGQIIIGMNHYPLLAGQPIFSLVPSAVQKNAKELTTMFADNGVNIFFTGHMHNQSVNLKVTDKGNKFYDVCTGSAIGFPAFIRYVEVFDNFDVSIKSIPVPDFKWDTKGKSCQLYMQEVFDAMIVNIIKDLKSNPEVLLRKFEVKPDFKIRLLFNILGNILNNYTLGRVSRLLFIKCDKSIRKIPLKEYAVEAVRNVFEGNQPDVEGTPKGNLIVAFLKRINFVLKKFKIKNNDGDEVQLFDILKDSFGNYGLEDNDIVINLKHD